MWCEHGAHTVQALVIRYDWRLQVMSRLQGWRLQVAEGVATAGAVVGLARRYRVSLPVLTAAAQVLDGNISPKKAVYEIMNLPQIEER